MKKLSILALAAAGLLLGACSDKNEVVQEVQNPVETEEGSYIGISIQMPNTTATTRANEDFKDGDTKEWEVKNANLLIFKTTASNQTEDDAVYVETYELPVPAVLDGDADNNVEATIYKATKIKNTLAAEITGSPATTKYYAYVIVNANGQTGTLTPGTTTFGDFRNLEFNQIGADIAAECNIGTGGLLMTNAPVCKVAGGDATNATALVEASNYYTLVEIDKTKIFNSEALAQRAGNQAACVYVERAAVKVTLSKAADFSSATELGTVNILGWQIINYEPTYYNTRKVEASWGDLASDYTPALVRPHLYRFVSSTAFAPQVPAAHTGPFRTYFAKDVQYNADATLSKTVAGNTWIALGKSGYTTENTFDVEHQTWKNTTQVTVKVSVNGGTGFYTVPGNDGLLNAANAKTQLETNIKSNLGVQSAFNALVAKLPALTAPNKYSLDVAVTITEPEAGSENVPYTATVGVKNGSEDVTIPTEANTEKAALETAVATARTANVAKFYKDGVTYYNARIQHFGEVETPWSATKPWTVVDPGTTVQQIYGFGQTTNGTVDEGADNSAKRFLGRYGVVRDNWYDLTIDAINELGSAEPIDVSGNGTPDDQVKSYMSVHVHLIPWVLRTQHISF